MEHHLWSSGDAAESSGAEADGCGDRFPTCRQEGARLSPDSDMCTAGRTATQLQHSKPRPPAAVRMLCHQDTELSAVHEAAGARRRPGQLHINYAPAAHLTD